MDFSGLKRYLDLLPEVFGVNSIEVSVNYKHNEVFHHTVGWSDAEKTKPTDRNDLQWIFSMTKVITCTAGLRMVERGIISLDDEVAKYLPEYKNLTVKKNGEIVPAQNKMLIKHLFSMSSGLDYNIASNSIKDAIASGKCSTREIVAAIAKEPLSFEPGTEFLYSLSHDVLAAVIEAASGKSFYEYLKQEIFEPLEMTDIGFSPTTEQLSRFSQQYRYDPCRYICKKTETSCAYRLTDEYESGGAGLFASNTEYMKVIDALANGGKAKNGYQLLKPETVKLFAADTRPEGAPMVKLGYGYGLGVRTLIDKEIGKSLSPLGEFGWDGAAASYCLADPINNIAIVLTTNIHFFGVGYDEIHPHVRNLVYMALGLDTREE